MKPAVLLQQAIWAILYHNCKISKPTSTLEKMLFLVVFLFCIRCARKTLRTLHCFMDTTCFFTRDHSLLPLKILPTDRIPWRYFRKGPCFHFVFKILRNPFPHQFSASKKSMIGRIFFGLSKVSQTFAEFAWGSKNYPWKVSPMTLELIVLPITDFFDRQVSKYF